MTNLLRSKVQVSYQTQKDNYFTTLRSPDVLSYKDELHLRLTYHTRTTICTPYVLYYQNKLHCTLNHCTNTSILCLTPRKKLEDCSNLYFNTYYLRTVLQEQNRLRFTHEHQELDYTDNTNVPVTTTRNKRTSGKKTTSQSTTY